MVLTGISTFFQKSIGRYSGNGFLWQMDLLCTMKYKWGFGRFLKNCICKSLPKKQKKKSSDQSKSLQGYCIFVLDFSFSKTVVLFKYLFNTCFMSTHRMGSERGVTILRK